MLVSLPTDWTMMTEMTALPTTVPLGGPGLSQVRNLVTAIPGPRSIEMGARKSAAVARGVGVALPIYVQAAGEESFSTSTATR